MSARTSKTTLFRWAIANFKNQRSSSNPIKFSSNFSLTAHPTFQFALFFNPTVKSFNDGFFGIELKQSDSSKPVELNVKFWLENENCEQFNERLYKKQIFGRVGDKCEFSIDLTGKNRNLFSKINNENKTLFICCELLELNANTSADYDRVFHQHFWALYEEGIHDAIIKIGDVEFKILKACFMAHSDVFKQMFQSKFKEGMTNTVEIKDVSEHAMKALIKWIYTQEIEDESLIEELFVVADKYQIQLLETICIDRMTASLNNDNVLTRFALADLHSNNDLKNAILEHIKSMSKEDSINCFTSPKWTEFQEKDVKAASEILKTIREKTIK